MRLHCITVNYRTPALALRLVGALVPQASQLGSAITVVDNGSGDSSVEILRSGIATLRPRIDLRVSERNLGFGAGNNLALRDLLGRSDAPEAIVLMNPDSVPEDDVLEKLLRVLERNPRAGIAGSGILDITGRPHASAFRFPSPLGELETRARLRPVSRALHRWRVPLDPGGTARRVDWVSGASCMLRTAMLREVGDFDEAFFLYFEETDLCRRARQAGWETWTVPESQVHHEGAVATGLDDPSRRRPRFWFDSRRRYFLKHHGRLGLVAANLGWLAGSAISGLRRWLVGAPRRDAPGLVLDFLRFSW